MTADTICIPPDRINEVLPLVTHWISNAVGKCGDWTPEAIKDHLDKGECLLWILWDGQLHAACVTQLVIVPKKGKICTIVACGGDQVIPWDVAFKPIEKYAAQHGCASMRIEGRPGWQRVFPDYELEWVCLHKDLN